MAFIDVTNLTFAYDGSFDNIFESVSFRIDTDWKLGFTGRNGRGKTTFLKLLLGSLEYSGKIAAPAVFEYFPYEIKHMEKTAINIIEEIIPDYEYWRLVKELYLLQIKEEVLYQSFDTLSSGEQTKLLLAALFLKEHAFLLIDEPTNHLDLQARKLVCNYLKSKKGFILVSHDRNFLDGCIDHILVINKTNIEIQKGNFSSWFQNKENQDNLERMEQNKLKKEINRLTAAAQRTQGWSDAVEKTKKGVRNSGLRPDRGFIGHKSAKMMKRAKNIESRKEQNMEEKKKLLKNIEEKDELKMNPLLYHNKNFLEIKVLSLFYSGKKIFDNMNFSVLQGERIALCGRNGCGKSSILKLIAGENMEYEGELILPANLKISYLPQNTSGLSGSLSDFIESHKLEESLFKTVLRKLDFSRVQFEKRLEEYSAGQKKKVLLAKSLIEPAHLFLWDEPLNYIDVISRIQIEELILKYQPTMIFVEHDNAFLENIATKKIGLDELQ